MAGLKDDRPLRERPLDLIYITFFAMHIPMTLLMDLQALYPAQFIPPLLTKLSDFYMAISNDPLIGGALYDPGRYSWFRSLLLLEGVFQLPVFILGAHGLLRGSRSIYVLLLIYGASTATTTYACLAVIFFTPTTNLETAAAKIASVTAEQRTFLLVCYLPFLLIPLAMSTDMAFRVLHLMHDGARASVALKTR
ncbi:hypothetical protein BDW22DRAFT_1380763 [Trametopsis cervina]|nr:hypothetical protein BDW22DRAFT_1380763 [Trametopsis cervina]